MTYEELEDASIEEYETFHATYTEKIPEIPREQIQTLWSIGHYDGPMNGIVKYNDQLYVVDCLDDPMSRSGRIFWMIEAPDEQIQKYIEYQEAWKNVAGNAMQWNPDGTHPERKLGLLGKHGTKFFRGAMDVWRMSHPRPSMEDLYKFKIIGWFKGWRLRQ